MSVSVYGFIAGITTSSQDAHNIVQLQALPETGAYLIKRLFSHIPQSQPHSYYGSHINFSAGYKEFYCLENDWLEEFETLLSNLYWSEAELIVTWSRERYTWRSNYSAEAPESGPNKITERSRYGSAWELKQVPWNS
ncbi:MULTISPECIES: hypothetical protein [Pseudomonas]|uniref:hypothetical protein n=1 Tax=Pseudomonas TaxID=286 RepID=UPI0012E0C013|nr:MULTISPECIES: hypothetical protein [Pseudomonas]